jgi:WD40 repeat protein
VGGQRVAVQENDELPCVTADDEPVVGDPADVGEWSAPFTWPVVAVHLHLLPNGRVLSWGNLISGSPRIWNPAAGGFTSTGGPEDLFCSGHAFLQDGRLLVAGGAIDYNLGIADINLYSTGAGWVSSTPMPRGRWYPTATTMANGQVVILAGSDETGIDVPVPEVWTSGSLRALTGASRVLPWYPRAFLAPNGRLFYAGEEQTSRYLNITGTGSWSTVANRQVATREYGSAVMYEPGKVLYAGGGRTTNTAEIIDLNKSSPSWQFTGPMEFPRRHHNLTILPTGEVLATDGVAGTGFNDLSQAVQAAEIWNPATGTWRTVASSQIPRGYHGTALLLPDGRVLQAGSGNGAGAPNQKNAELYSPPYLFAGPRPTIGSAPDALRYGTTATVNSPDAGSIATISLIRLGSVTHAFDENTRYVPLSFSRNANKLNVTIPSSRNRIPPGHYMLFLVNGSGVPSVAKIVRVRS